MKIIFSVLFFNLFIFATTTTATDIIYDSAGNKLLRGLPYYILPLLRGTGGGLTLSQATKNTCPLNVTQEPFEVNHGVPFIFNPIILDEEFIRGSYPTSIEADVQNPCHDSNILKVSTANLAKKDDDNNDDDDAIFKVVGKDHKKKKDDDKKDVAPVSIATAGGEFNKPESCFQIVEDAMMPGLQSYQIQYCPFKCGSSSSVLTCYNVGLISDADGKNYLAPTDAIFPVVFTNSFGAVKSVKMLSAFGQLSAKVTSFSRSSAK